MPLSEQDLPEFAASSHLCWVQDIDRARVVWANATAVKAFLAESAEAFYARDVSPLSAASRTRLEVYRARAAAGASQKTQWTTYVNAVTPLTMLASIHPYALPDGRIALLFDAIDIGATTCPESLRMIEAARQSHFCYALFNQAGHILERNAAFLRQFGDSAIATVLHDDFVALFADPEEGEHVRAAALARGEYRGRVQLKQREGMSWHLMMAITIIDPVDGARVLHVETTDISNEVEAEVRARNAEALLQRIADEVPTPIAYVNAEARFTFANRTYASWSGHVPGDIVGKPMIEATSERAHALLAEGIAHVQRGERYEYERLATVHGMGERWIRVELIPHLDAADHVAGTVIFGSDIQALKDAQEGQRISDVQLELIADNLPVAVALFDMEHRVRFANRRFGAWFGLTREALIERHAVEVFGVEVYDSTRTAREKALAGESSYFRRQTELNGQTRWIDVTLAPYYESDRIIAGFIAVYVDVTARVEANAALNQTRDTLARHLANTPLAVVQLDLNRRVIQWTGRATETFGWTEDEARGRTVEELAIFDTEASEGFQRQLEKLRLGEAERLTVSLRSRRRDGSAMHGEWFGSVLRGGVGKRADDVSYFLLVQDVSARVSAEHHLQYVANHDVLTGLANRTQFQDRLRQEVARARRHNHRVGVFLIDLDRFKYVNESMGHNAGDLLLQQLAMRLAEVTGDGDLVARTGGDEFMMLFELDDDDHAARIASELLQMMTRPLKLGEQEIFVTMSIGVSVFPEDADNEQELTKNADWALYQAKDAGRNGVQYYSRSAANDAPSRLTLETELRRVVTSGQLVLHYQPKQSLTNGRITGVEALVRWRHPRMGLVQPDQFITLAEETGLIVGIGNWVIHEACRQAAEWRATYGAAPQVAINISPMQLSRRQLSTEILDAIAMHRLPGSAIMVEITETGVVSDPYLATLTLEALRSHGVQAAIDDFGKGYSSLTQLKRLPIDALKIDSSFVRDLVTDRDDAAIIQAIVGLGRSLDLRTIAEGVETPEQMATLLKYGCDEIQGYFLSRPVSASDFAELFLQP